MQISSSGIENALKAFCSGKLVAIPTETVYGLSAPIHRLELVEKIFKLKDRPFFDPLILHVDSIEMAKHYVHWNSVAQKLAQKFWPGPLTLVLPKKKTVPDIITAGLDTVGLRVPEHPLALNLIKRLEVGLAAPSANKFSKVSPTDPKHVAESFSKEDVYILDGGRCNVGIESTIVAVNENSIEELRPGMITIQMLEQHCKDTPIKKTTASASNMPGGFKQHYRPSYRLFTTVKSVDEKEKKLLKEKYHVKCFEEREFGPYGPALAARELYSFLRHPPKKGCDGVLVKVIMEGHPDKWAAILNRLEKASVLLIS